MDEIKLTCAFCDEKFVAKGNIEQVQTERFKDKGVQYERLMVFRCPTCRAAKVSTTKFGAPIVVPTGIMVAGLDSE